MFVCVSYHCCSLKKNYVRLILLNFHFSTFCFFLFSLPSEDSGSSDSDDEGGKLNETLDDDNHEKIKDFDDIRTSSPCSYKDNDYNMDIDNNDRMFYDINIFFCSFIGDNWLFHS